MSPSQLNKPPFYNPLGQVRARLAPLTLIPVVVVAGPLCLRASGWWWWWGLWLQR